MAPNRIKETPQLNKTLTFERDGKGAGGPSLWIIAKILQVQIISVILRKVCFLKTSLCLVAQYEHTKPHDFSTQMVNFTLYILTSISHVIIFADLVF